MEIMFYKEERLALFIDGVSVYSASKALGFDLDYRKLKQEFARRGRMMRMFYYNFHSEDEEFSPMRPLMDWLGYNGFTVTTKPMRSYTVTGNTRTKGSIAVELTTDALLMAPHMDHAVLFTGEGDYAYMVQALQRQGVRVSVVSTLKTDHPMISDELRKQADNFIELAELREVIGRLRSSVAETTVSGVRKSS
jgi:uncharacterized LabA/DUF88 family protein